MSGLYLKVVRDDFMSKYADRLGWFALKYEVGQTVAPKIGGIYVYRRFTNAVEYVIGCRLLVVEGEEIAVKFPKYLELRFVNSRNLKSFWNYVVKGKTKSDTVRYHSSFINGSVAFLSSCKVIKDISIVREGSTLTAHRSYYDRNYFIDVGYHELWAGNFSSKEN